MKKTMLLTAVMGTALWAQNSSVQKTDVQKADVQKADVQKAIDERRHVTVQVAPGEMGAGPIGIQAAMAGPMAAVTGAPYSAEAVTERVQTLADGNRIVQNTSNTVARDGQGRLRRDESLAMALPGEKDHAPKLQTIDDPVAGVHWTLDPQNKTAVKMIMPRNRHAMPAGAIPAMPLLPALPAAGPDKTWFYATGAPGSPIHLQTMTARKADDEKNVTRTDLGTQTIEGVEAKGTRITRTLPAGDVGNEQPIVITTETWYSPDLKVLVMSKADDPRMGTTTYKLTNIQRGEPLPTLFEVPSDYTVKEGKQNVFFYRSDKSDKKD